MGRFTPVIILAAGLACIGILLGISDEADIAGLRYVAFAVIPVCGLAGVAWKKSRAKATRSAAPDGVEHEIDVAARSDAFRDVIVIVPVLLVISLWEGQLAAWGWLAILMMLALGDYWARVLLRRPRGN